MEALHLLAEGTLASGDTCVLPLISKDLGSRVYVPIHPAKGSLLRTEIKCHSSLPPRHARNTGSAASWFSRGGLKASGKAGTGKGREKTDRNRQQCSVTEGDSVCTFSLPDRESPSLLSCVAECWKCWLPR